jgi:hypothetical protein
MTDMEDELPELPELITISLASVLMGVSRQAAHKMVRSGRLDAWRIRSAGSDRPLVVREKDVLEMKKSRHKVVTVTGFEGDNGTRG